MVLYSQSSLLDMRLVCRGFIDEHVLMNPEQDLGGNVNKLKDEFLKHVLDS